jgi:hypothetical protein
MCKRLHELSCSASPTFRTVGSLECAPLAGAFRLRKLYGPFVLEQVLRVLSPACPFLCVVWVPTASAIDKQVIPALRRAGIRCVVEDQMQGEDSYSSDTYPDGNCEGR